MTEQALSDVKVLDLSWYIAGPYTQAGKGPQELFDIVFPPEKPDAKNVKWKMVGNGKPSEHWQIDLTRVIGGDNRVAYLRTTIDSLAKQAVNLEIGSDDGVKVWLNGKLVHANNTLRGVVPGQDRPRATLVEGKNTLLLKITQGGGGWGAAEAGV